MGESESSERRMNLPNCFCAIRDRTPHYRILRAAPLPAWLPTSASVHPAVLAPVASAAAFVSASGYTAHHPRNDLRRQNGSRSSAGRVPSVKMQPGSFAPEFLPSTAAPTSFRPLMKGPTLNHCSCGLCLGSVGTQTQDDPACLRR